MIKTYIKECLYILDYKNNIIDCIFNSADHNTPGYAYNINLTEGNTGYSNLTFTMPTKITKSVEEGNIDNPKINNLHPLAKIRYERQCIYIGDEPITVNYPIERGDKPQYYISKTFYKGDLIEIDDAGNNISFIMDYIIQPQTKKRSGLELAINYSAIDYPRFDLSKKKVGLTIDDTTLVEGSSSIYDTEPLNIPGQIVYRKWDVNIDIDDFGETRDNWDPTGSSYPLTERQIALLLEHLDAGIGNIVYYWPVIKFGRFKGIAYNAGDFITLGFYRKPLSSDNNEDSINSTVMEGNYWLWYYNSTEHIKRSPDAGELLIYGINDIGKENYQGSITNEEQASSSGWNMYKEEITEKIHIYNYEWGIYQEGKPYLTPNNPFNYLRYILEDSGWTIKKKYTEREFKGFYPNANNLPTTDRKEDDYLIVREPVHNTLSYKKKAQEDPWFSSFNELKDYFSNLQDGDWAVVYEINNGEHLINTYTYYEQQGWILDTIICDRLDRKVYTYNNGSWMLCNENWIDSIDRNTGILYDVDQVETQYIISDGQDTGKISKVELTTNINLNNSNCYNGISQLCQSFNLYPSFDCLKREVSLYAFSGKNYGLTYSLGRTIKDDNVVEDGDKVITKLHCYGGSDVNGDEVINLGSAPRTYEKRFADFFRNDNERDSYTNGGFICIVDADIDKEHPWIEGEERRVCYKDTTGWHDAEFEEGVYTFTLDGITYYVDGATGQCLGEDLKWNPNYDEYIADRSPYGTEYLYNFKYLYDKGIMSKEDILNIYQQNKKIRQLNEGVLSYYVKTYGQYLQDESAYQANYKTLQDRYMAKIHNMQNRYYKDPASSSSEEFYAFPYPTRDMIYQDDSFYIELNEEIIPVDVYGYGECTQGSYNPITGAAQKGDYYYLIKDFDEDIFKFPDETKTEESMERYLAHLPFSLTEQIIPNPDRSENVIEQKEYLVLLPDEEAEGGYSFQLVVDKSNHMTIWNEDVENWQKYYQQQKTEAERVNEVAKMITALENKYNEYNIKLNQINNEIQTNWGSFIIEGQYKDNTICYDNILMTKSLEASNKYCIPKKEYGVNVIDNSGLFEYRNICDDSYNEIIQSLYNIGQICPKAGDYVSVFDRNMGFEGIPATITEIKRVLDNPVENTVTIDTNYTDEDEFVANVMNATNIVLDNKDMITRNTIINKDGTINSSGLNEAISSPKANLTFVSNQGSVTLDPTGLITIDPDNPQRQIKYSAAGALVSIDGGLTWDSLITEDGIDVNKIKAGTLDANKVQITTGYGNKVILNSSGLIIKNEETKEYHIPDTNDWSKSNIAAFIGVNKRNEPRLFLAGQMKIEDNSSIAGWNITTNSIEKEKNNNFISISSENGIHAGSIIGSNKQDNFSIGLNGDIVSKSGTIGGWNIGTNSLSSSSNKVILNSNESNGLAINVNGGVFSVGFNGAVTCGNINATGGSIGGWSISSGSIMKNGVGLKATSTSNDIIAKNIRLGDQTSVIGGWTIDADRIKRVITVGDGTTTLSLVANSSNNTPYISLSKEGSGYVSMAIDSESNLPVLELVGRNTNKSVILGGDGILIGTGADIMVDGSVGASKKIIINGTTLIFKKGVLISAY